MNSFLHEAAKAKLIEILQDAGSIRALAKKLDISTQAIYAYLKRYGVKNEEWKRNPPEEPGDQA